MRGETGGELNSVGVPHEQTRSMEGGMSGRGNIGNMYPTGIVADGNDVKARDVFNRGARRGSSVERNESKARNSSRK